MRAVPSAVASQHYAPLRPTALPCQFSKDVVVEITLAALSPNKSTTQKRAGTAPPIPPPSPTPVVHLSPPSPSSFLRCGTPRSFCNDNHPHPIGHRARVPQPDELLRAGPLRLRARDCRRRPLSVHAPHGAPGRHRRGVGRQQPHHHHHHRQNRLFSLPAACRTIVCINGNEYGNSGGVCGR